MSEWLRSIIPTTEVQQKPRVLDRNKVKEKSRLKQEKQKYHFDQHTKRLPVLEKGEHIITRMVNLWEPGLVSRGHHSNYSTCYTWKRWLVGFQAVTLEHLRKFLFKTGRSIWKVGPPRRSTRSRFFRLRRCVSLVRLFMKAYWASSCIVSSKGTLVNREDTVPAKQAKVHLACNVINKE